MITALTLPTMAPIAPDERPPPPVLCEVVEVNVVGRTILEVEEGEIIVVEDGETVGVEADADVIEVGSVYDIRAMDRDKEQ
jgi:hypothetical protein